MNNNLTPLQAKLLEALKWFDAFCREKHLRYYAIGGTLLGAMRHQGFIPWDDDIDLGMPRSDYEKLKGYVKTEKDRFRFETYDSAADDYCYPINKLYDSATTLVEHKRVNVVRGVFIDIFPIDGIGNTLEESYSNYIEVEKTYRFYLTMIAGVRKGRSLLKNVAVIACKLIPRCFVNQRSLRIKLNSICSKYDFDHYKFGGNLIGAYGKREIVDLSLFGTPRDYKFEDIIIAGPQDADGYLTRIYHDWRKLPPKEKQVSHHDFVSLDLNKPYIE